MSTSSRFLLSENNYQLFQNQNPSQQPPLQEPETMMIDTVIYNIHNNLTTTSSSSTSYGLNDLTPGYFKITKEEIENIKNKKVMNILSNHIEVILNKNPTKLYNLTKYTLFVIDELQADVYISTETNENGIMTYYYKIVSKNIYYETDEDDNSTDEKNKDLVIYDNYGFVSLICLLEDIKYVETNYKLLDYYLLSPTNMEEALAQREFIPINQDKICTVCYEPTIEYTTCNHSICLKCREKCIMQGKKTCPICRTSNLCIYPL